jgi:hypothetical protein
MRLYAIRYPARTAKSCFNIKRLTALAFLGAKQRDFRIRRPILA